MSPAKQVMIHKLYQARTAAKLRNWSRARNCMEIAHAALRLHICYLRKHANSWMVNYVNDVKKVCNFFAGTSVSFFNFLNTLLLEWNDFYFP